MELKNAEKNQDINILDNENKLNNIRKEKN